MKPTFSYKRKKRIGDKSKLTISCRRLSLGKPDERLINPGQEVVPRECSDDGILFLLSYSMVRRAEVHVDSDTGHRYGGLLVVEVRSLCMQGDGVPDELNPGFIIVVLAMAIAVDEVACCNSAVDFEAAVGAYEWRVRRLVPAEVV